MLRAQGAVRNCAQKAAISRVSNLNTCARVLRDRALNHGAWDKKLSYFGGITHMVVGVVGSDSSLKRL